MKYAFIERHRHLWPICVQCRVLQVSASGFHQHRTRRRQIAHRRHLTDAALLAHISALYAEHRGAYGWPRIWRELVKRGIRVGKQRVQRLMQQHGILASMSRKGNCWDNAVTETWFGSLKVERLHGERFETIRQAKDAVHTWLLWYNRQRMHSTLNYLSPAEFESRWGNSGSQAA